MTVAVPRLSVHRQVADSFRASHGDMVDFAIAEGYVKVIDEQKKVDDDNRSKK